MQHPGEGNSVAIVGGGLAGLAAAAALARFAAERNPERNLERKPAWKIELFESRRTLGGRAGSFLDPETGQLLDHCQHVGMGCCTNFADFCRQTGVDSLLRRDRVLHFFGPDGRRYDLSAARWLPAPGHLGPSLMRLGYLTLSQRLGVARALLRLARLRISEEAPQPTFGQWLREQRQAPAAVDRFWSIVIVSALSEDVDAVALSVARKVFVDGFMAHRQAYEIAVPTRSLGELYGEHVAGWLREHGVTLHLGRSAARLMHAGDSITGVVDGQGIESPCEAVIVACPWRRVAELVPDGLRERLPELQALEQFSPAPITALHLWFDRPITELPHAVLIDRLSQWVFSHGKSEPPRASTDELAESWYYQVVVSASRQLAGRPREDVLAEVRRDLAAVWPESEAARLLHWRMVTQHEAVFSPRPETERQRPAQQSSLDNLYWAGDWTRTGWPATMEGAVRSGYLAAEALLAKYGQRPRIVVPDLPRNWLTRRLCGG
ncbi:MAG: hydroxysqualene dehydroxylase HpnE [Pirellulaceae bacterium]